MPAKNVIPVKFYLTLEQRDFIDNLPGKNGRGAKIVSVLAQTYKNWPTSPQRGQHIRKPITVQPAPESEE